MGKRGPKPKGNISTEWSHGLAYAVGLLVSDGCLYKDGLHISLVTKDLDQAENFIRCLGLTVKIGIHNKKYYRVQFGDVLFYKFLLSLGLTPAKSKTIGVIKVPSMYFFDYLRGYFDGDGCVYSYWDKRWRSSHLFYVAFACASESHVKWLRKSLFRSIGVRGHVADKRKGGAYQLRYAKGEGLEIISKMYYDTSVVCLSRKRLKVQDILLIESRQQALYR